MNAAALPVLAIALPIAGVVLAPLLGARGAQRLLLFGLLPAGLAVAVLLAVLVAANGAPIRVDLGGWAPPLGVAFRADGLAAAFLLVTVVVVGAAALAARRSAMLAVPGAGFGARAPLAFWALLPALWAGVNLAVLGHDLFTFFIALELLTFGAVPLVALDGRRATLEAALRYLMFALLGSALFLLGVALLYGATGALDLGLVARAARPGAATILAAALMTAGLLAKTALVPLHLWLPPAHAGAPPAVSAVLSALVVKGSFVILLRLWFEALPALLVPAVAQLLAGLGALAILFGGVVALKQERLKLLVAYSTVAQIGYLFLMIPLVLAGAMDGYAERAWLGGALQAVSHALAKAAMFLAVGLMAEALGHDRIARIGGVARAVPLGLAAFALGGLSLVGIPPSGGFTAKWLLLTSAIGTGQWWWALVILSGGLLTFGYLYRVLGLAFAGPRAAPVAAVSRARQAVPLALALLSIGMGLLPLVSFGLVQVGRPVLPWVLP